ncbi:MAG: DUF3810 family protein [Lachnospiraceae bacterium]|nr:DUF3810 family protein [Lachnospiraceae bacterium]
MKKKLTPYLKTVLILSAITIVLALPALSPRLCDSYTDNVYPVLRDVISHITALFPFAVGEILMYLGILAVLAAAVMLFLFIFLREKSGYRRFLLFYFKAISIALLVLVLLYMPTWFVPFCGTVLGEGDRELRTEFSYEEIVGFLAYAAENGNAAAEEIEIGEDGRVSFHSAKENTALAAKAMSELSGEYGRLSGYYPPVKEAICSDILDRMEIGGYNYPFTMEPTHNRYMSPLYQPLLDAHELAHHMGYYKENEANFLSELALSRSEDPYLRLSAYMRMHSYVADAYMEACFQNDAEPGELPGFSKRAMKIYKAGLAAEQEIYEADTHVIDEIPAADEAIRDAADRGWDIQGEILKENSYDGVVLLLLQYYYCSGE